MSNTCERLIWLGKNCETSMTKTTNPANEPFQMKLKSPLEQGITMTGNCDTEPCEDGNDNSSIWFSRATCQKRLKAGVACSDTQIHAVLSHEGPILVGFQQNVQFWCFMFIKNLSPFPAKLDPSYCLCSALMLQDVRSILLDNTHSTPAPLPRNIPQDSGRWQ